MKTIRRMLTLMIMRRTYRRKRNKTLPLHATINNNNYITSACMPFIKVIQGSRTCPLNANTIRVLRLIMMNNRANYNHRTIISPKINMNRRVITLCLRFHFFNLKRSNLTITRHNCISLSTYIVCLSGQNMYPYTIQNVIRKRRNLRLRIFRRVPLPMRITQTAMILNFHNVHLRICIRRQIIRLYLLRSKR